MSVKDDIINELGNIPLEVMKPADNTNYVQQQLEKDSWGRKLNTQTFKQFEDSINILKGSSMYTLNTMVELETFNTEILRLDNKNISQDLDINSKVDFTTYTTKMAALDNKDADLQLQLNNIPNLYVDKTKYNTKMTSLDLKDTELTTLVNSKVDSNVYSTNISNLQSQVSSKVSNTTYTNDLNSINIKNNNQDSLINNLQSNKADILYVDSQIDILENVNTVQDNAIDNLILTKADKSDVLTKLEMNSTLNNYALKSYVDGTFLTTTNASSTYVSLANYNNSELIHNNEILSLQNGKANITDIYTRTQGDQRYLLRSEYTGGTGATTSMIQKNGVLSVSGIRQANATKDVYLVDIPGIDEFGTYDGMKLLIDFDQTNQTNLVYLLVNNTEYKINDIVQNELQTNNKYLCEMKNNIINIVINKQATETINGTSKIATQTEVDNGLEDTKIVTSKKLKARLDSFLAGITGAYVKLTQLATESLAGIIKISTTAQVSAGTDNTTAVSPAKLKARLDSLLAGITSTYVKLTQLATESLAGIIKISTTAQVSAGTDNTTAVSPAKLSEAFANLKATNGYQKLPNGMIIQWGGANFSGTTGETGEVITLPVAFPNAFLRITGTDGGHGANAIGITIISKSQFRCWGRIVSSGAFSDTGFHWVAIGY